MDPETLIASAPYPPSSSTSFNVRGGRRALVRQPRSGSLSSSSSSMLSASNSTSGRGGIASSSSSGALTVDLQTPAVLKPPLYRVSSGLATSDPFTSTDALKADRDEGDEGQMDHESYPGSFPTASKGMCASTPSAPSPVDIIGRLPPELSHHTLAFLDDPQDLLRVARVSKLYKTYAQDDRLWHEIFNTESSAYGWESLAEAQYLWSKLQPVYRRQWFHAQFANGKKEGRVKPSPGDGSGSNGIPSRVGDDGIIPTEVLSGPMNWRYLYRMRHILATQRWALTLGKAGEIVEHDSASSGAASNDEEDDSEDEEGSHEEVEDSSDVEMSEADNSSPSDESQARPVKRIRNINPELQHLKGHEDSIYCVLMDPRPFSLPSEVSESLREQHRKGPLYDPLNSLGIGTRGRIYSGSRDKTIKIWDGDSGICLHTLTGHEGSVLCLTFNDRMLLSGSSDRQVLVWDLAPLEIGETPKLMKRLRGHTAGVLDLAILGRWALSCGKDAVVRVYDLNDDLRLWRTYTNHRGPVNAGCLSDFEGSVKAATASGEGSVQLWDVESGQLLRTFEGHKKGLACVKFSCGVIITGSNDYTVRVWDAKTGACLAVLRHHTDLVRAVHYDNKKGLVFSGGYDGRVKVFDARSSLSSLGQRGRSTRRSRQVSEVIDLVAMGEEVAGRIFCVCADATRILSCGDAPWVSVYDFARGCPLMRLLT